jgi:hypothetical protein
MEGTETHELLARCVSETPRQRMNPTNSFARFTFSISALSISIRFRLWKSCQELFCLKARFETGEENTVDTVRVNAFPRCQQERGLQCNSIMPRKSKLKLPALKLGRGERGSAHCSHPQGAWLHAERTCRTHRHDPSPGLRDKLRLNDEMAVRFAIALEVSTDELLGLNSGNGDGKGEVKSEGKKPSRKVTGREAQHHARSNRLLRTSRPEPYARFDSKAGRSLRGDAARAVGQ